MSEIQSVIDKCIDTLLAWEDKNEIMQMIGSEIARLNTDDLQQDELFSIAQSLAVLQFNLSDMYVNGKMAFNTTYCFRKFDSSMHYLTIQDRSQKDREQLATVHVQDTYKNEIYLNMKAEKLSYLYKNVDRIISLLQTRIKMLTNQQFQSNVQT